MYFSLFVVVSLLTSGIHSISVNNVTVSRDFFVEFFYKTIRKDKDMFGIVARDSKEYDSKKCMLSLREIVNRLPSDEVASFIDAWGKYPSGVLFGNNYDIGNYEQCVKTSVNLNEEIGSIRGQFCFAKIPLKKQSSRAEFDTTVRDVNIGICVPNVCSPEYLTSIFEKSYTDDILNGVLSGMTIAHCTDGKRPPLKTINIVAICVFGTFTGLMILSSLYDFFMNYYGKSTVPVLLAFSILINGKKLFAINTKKSPNNIDCLTGIRVLSMIWIMNHHMYSNVLSVPTVNKNDFFSWKNTFISMPASNGTLIVDSFFFIGGLLIAWIGFRDLDKTKGRLNIVMNNVHRYIRLTPVLGAGLLLAYGINELLYTGPFRDQVLAMRTCNGNNWWPILIYIQNYFIQDAKCYDEAWYLAVDFQLYILSPLLLIPMWKWGKKFVPVVIGLIIASMAWVMAVFFMEGFTAMTIGGNDGEWEKTYTPTHTRCGPWLVGFILGYFMHKNRQTTFRLSKIVVLLGWIASFVTLAAIVFGPYFTLSAYGKGTVFEAAVYEGCKRVSWGLALAWITFACQYGFGGFVDAFLSHPFWQPLGRLTYALYLMHMAVIKMHYGMMRTEMYFSVYNIFLGFWSAFGISILIAIYMSLAFEAPILVLEKFIFGHGKADDKKPHVEPKIIAELPQKEV